MIEFLISMNRMNQQQQLIVQIDNRPFRLRS